MNDPADRLSRCFSAVFPKLPPDRVARASTRDVPEWDSLATMTLVSVIEEEFGVRVRAVDVEGFHSFQSILDFLGRPPAADSHAPPGGAPSNG